MAFGLAERDPGARRSGLEDQLTDWRIAFAARTHGFQASTALLYGKLLAKAQKVGRPMSVINAQIAAIAIKHGFALATRNVSDFTTTGLTLLNPWLDQPDGPGTG